MPGPGLTSDQQELQALVQELDAVEREVNLRLAPRGTSTKEIPFEFSESFVFHTGDMKAKKRTFKNGAEDLYFSEPQFVVVVSEVNEPNTDPQFVEDNLAFQGLFDFFWNYSIGSQGENYGTTANDMLWLSRPGLGNRDRWLPLAYQYPLRLKAGDAITIIVKPSYYGVAIPNADSANITVNMTMTGRRNGHMAESQFDPEFRPAYRSDRK